MAELTTYPTAAALATDVAARLLRTLAAAQADAGAVPQVALTGGTIAEAIHEEVARLADEDPDQVDWSRVVVWWGDERFVPGDDQDRNCLQAREAFLDQVDVDPSHVHEMPSADDYPDVDAAARAYSDDLREHGAGEFDVVMLGVGPDGHIASLFPGYPQLDVTDRIAVGVTDSPKPPPLRVSLTFEALNHAREVWFVVSGDGKAGAVARALATGDDAPTVQEIPAAGVRGRERTVWFVDEAAASQL